jgi:hypothetical protein
MGGTPAPAEGTRYNRALAGGLLVCMKRGFKSALETAGTLGLQRYVIYQRKCVILSQFFLNLRVKYLTNK